MSNGVTVLVFGDVNGNFSVLFRYMDKLKSKLKNIGLAVCVGNFFGQNCDEEWQQVKDGKLRAPLQMYILGPTSEELRRFYSDCINMTDLTERITYLGKSGTYRTAEGLKLAYISGRFDEHKSSEITYSYDDIKKLVKDSTYGRPDLLLTWSWPHDFAKFHDVKTKSETKEVASTFLFSYLAPQYHFSSRENESIVVTAERMYDDKSSAGKSSFIGLKYLESKKSKDLSWLKVLEITPYSVKEKRQKMDTLKILPLPIPGIDGISQKVNICTEPQFNRYNIAPKNKEKFKKRSKTKEEKDSPCWFCFSEPDFEKHMVVAIGDYSYLTIAKGPIVDDHLLISTIYHLPSMRVVSEEIRMEIARFKKIIRKFYRPSCFAVFYERSFSSKHLQIQCVPVPMDKLQCIAPAFKELAKEYNLDITEYKAKTLSYKTLDEDAKYFHVDLNDGHELLISGNSSFPINFGREALIMESVLNMPEKKNWTKSVQSKSYDIELVKKIQHKLMKLLR